MSDHCVSYILKLISSCLFFFLTVKALQGPVIEPPCRWNIAELHTGTQPNVHVNSYLQRCIRGEGGWNFSPKFLICCIIRKRFCLHWKVYHLLNKMRYILREVVLLEACDVTNNGRHLGFYQELKIRLKPREMEICLCFTWKIIHK